jgi:hypothetical protein
VLAVAVFGAVMVPIFDRSLDDRLARIGVAPAVREAVEAQRSKPAAIVLPAGIDAPSRAAAQRAIGEAFVTGFRWIMLISSLLALASAATSRVLIGGSSGVKRR